MDFAKSSQADRGRPLCSTSGLAGHLSFTRYLRHAKITLRNGARIIREHLAKIAPKGKYVLHGLRKAAGVALAEAGVEINGIMAVMGHRSPRMALYYTQQAKKSKLTDAAMTAWEQADERAEAA
jgi:integrase